MMFRQFPVDHKAEFEKYVFLKPNMFLFKQYILAGELTKWLKKCFNPSVLYLCRHYSCKLPLQFRLRMKTVSLKDYVKLEYQNNTTLCLYKQWLICAGFIDATNIIVKH